MDRRPWAGPVRVMHPPPRHRLRLGDVPPALLHVPRTAEKHRLGGRRGAARCPTPPSPHTKPPSKPDVRRGTLRPRKRPDRVRWEAIGIRDVAAAEAAAPTAGRSPLPHLAHCPTGCSADLHPYEAGVESWISYMGRGAPVCSPPGARRTGAEVLPGRRVRRWRRAPPLRRQQAARPTDLGRRGPLSQRAQSAPGGSEGAQNTR
jgi:hypothetical protein